MVLEGERVELLSSRPFAPGSRPLASLAAGGNRVWLKVHGSRQQDNGSYLVTGRLLNATREVRAALEEAIQNSPERC
jgi:hypothetical protein